MLTRLSGGLVLVALIKFMGMRQPAGVVYETYLVE